MASLKTSRGWTKLASSVPIEMVEIPIIFFRVLIRISLKCSLALSFMLTRTALTTDSGLLMLKSLSSGSKSCLFANSKQALIYAALAKPMPLTCDNSSKVA